MMEELWNSTKKCVERDERGERTEDGGNVGNDSGWVMTAVTIARQQ